jgi:hypothetical protein
MSSEIEGLDDLHAFLKLGNHVTRFSFPHMDRPLIAPALIPRNIREEDMWLNPLAPQEPSESDVIQSVGTVTKTPKPAIVAVPKAPSAPGVSALGKPPVRTPMPLFHQKPDSDLSTNL